MSTRRVVAISLFSWSLVSLFSLFSLFPDRAAAAEPGPGLIDYQVKKGDTCASIARRLWGDARRVDLIHENNPNMGPSPHKLVPGTVLRLPPAPGKGSTGPDARLLFLRNKVETYTPERKPGRPNEPLSRGNRVSTLDASAAEVMFVDETRLQLGENTLIVIFGDTSAKVKKTAADTTLVSGSLRAHLGALAGRKTTGLPVATPAGKVTVGEGEAQVAVDPQKTTRLAVYRGKSKLRASGKEVAVPEGFGSSAKPGKAPTPPRPLPPAPVWTSPPPSVVLVRAGQTGEVSGTYGPGTGPGPAPARWHVQLSRDRVWNDVAVDVRVPIDVTRLEGRQLEPGRYFARVSAIDADDFEGPAGPTVEISVEAAALAPAAAGARARVAAPADRFCGLDGAPLTKHTAPVELSPGRDHVLRCAAAADGANATELRIAAADSGPLVITTRTEPARRTAEGAEQEMVVDLRDAASAPVGDLPVEVRPGPGASADPPTKVSDGVYRTRVRWSPATAPATIALSAGTETRTVTLAALPALPPAPPPPPPSQTTVHGELGVLATGRLVPAWNGGAGVGVEAGLTVWGANFEFAVALRPRYEHLFDPARSYLAAGLPLTLRLRAQNRDHFLYLGLVPELTYSLQTEADRAATATTGVGISGLLGYQLAGGVFAEIGYASPAFPAIETGDALYGSFFLHLGWRLPHRRANP